jgi:hypothetical protein
MALVSSGYYEFPGGFIIQWGQVASGTSGNITFPIAWPNGLFAITGSENNSSALTNTIAFNMAGATKTLIPYAQTTSYAFTWIAIGN